VRGGHPDPLRCRPTAAPPAPVVRRETRTDSAQTFPLRFTIPAPRRRDACDVRGETGHDTTIEATNGRRAPRAGGWRGRPARFDSKLSGGATKDLCGNQYFEYSTVRSTHELLLYPYNTQTHAGASTAAFEWNVQDPISH
jgi:hypothetical protein